MTDILYRTADTRKPRDNAIMRRLACSVVRKLGTVFNSGRLQFSEIAVASFLGVPSPLRFPDNVLRLNGRDSPFVNTVTYLGVTFNRTMTRRHHIGRTVDKALRTYVRTYSLFKSERLSTNIKFAFYKALIMSVTTYACPT
jgi:hypothetical protein